MDKQAISKFLPPELQENTFLDHKILITALINWVLTAAQNCYYIFALEMTGGKTSCYEEPNDSLTFAEQLLEQKKLFAKQW